MMSQQDNSVRPKVSVITVTFNAASMLERTLQSVEKQNYKALETIIVDGGSKDGTVDIIRRHSANITRWVSEPDGGIYDAMNKGLRMASGEWVIFMNAGDTFAGDDVLDKIFSQSQQNDADIIYGDVLKDGKVKKAPSEYYLYHRMLFCHQSSLSRRSILLSCPFDTSHRLSADLKFFLTQYLHHARFHYVDFPIANFDTSGVSNSRRSTGLKDNMRVVSETIPMPMRLKFLLRLMVPYVMCKIKGK